jgi:hypothetical protein
MPRIAAGRSGSRPTASTMVLGELCRQRRLEHDHRNARFDMLARDLQAFGGVGIDQFAETLVGVADRREPIRVGAAAGDEAVLGKTRGLVGPQREHAAAPDLVGKQAARARGVALQQIEHEAFEVRGLRDVHRRARGLVGLGAAAHAIGSGAEELVEHVVLVRREHEFLDRQAHHAATWPAQMLPKFPDGTAKLTCSSSHFVAWK